MFEINYTHINQEGILRGVGTTLYNKELDLEVEYFGVSHLTLNDCMFIRTNNINLLREISGYGLGGEDNGLYRYFFAEFDPLNAFMNLKKGLESCLRRRPLLLKGIRSIDSRIYICGEFIKLIDIKCDSGTTHYIFETTIDLSKYHLKTQFLSKTINDHKFEIICESIIFNHIRILKLLCENLEVVKND